VTVPPPLATLTDALLDARTNGDEFDNAWNTAVDLALTRIQDSEGRRQWREAFNAVRDEFEACYTRAPTRTGAVMANIINHL
jgi:hypothetical protein